MGNYRIRIGFPTNGQYQMQASGSSYALTGQDVTLTADVASDDEFDYYIGPSGSDSNDGLTTSTPWAITALNTKAATYAGKRVGLMDGIYRLTGGNSEYIIDVPSTASGDSGTHTVIEGVTVRGATLTTNDGSGNYLQSGGIGATDTLQVNATFIDFKNFNIIDTAGHGITILNGDDILIEGMEFSELRGYRKSTYTDNNMGGVFFRTQSTPKTNITIRNCLFEDIYALASYVQSGLNVNNSNGVGDLFGAHSLTVENCTFRRMGVPMFFKGQARNVIFRNNFVTECAGGTQMFMTMNSGNSPCENQVYGNIFNVNWMFGPNSSNTQGDSCPIARFYNNTVVMKAVAGSNSCDFGYMVWAGGGTAQDIYFYNNAIYLDAGFGLGSGMIRFPGSTEAIATRISVWDYNRYSRFNIEDNVGSASYNALANWQATGRDTHSPVVGTLGLSNLNGSAVADFAPAGGSALLSAGKTGGTTGGSTVNIGHTGVGTTWGCDFG